MSFGSIIGSVMDPISFGLPAGAMSPAIIFYWVRFGPSKLKRLAPFRHEPRRFLRGHELPEFSLGPGNCSVSGTIGIASFLDLADFWSQL